MRSIYSLLLCLILFGCNQSPEKSVQRELDQNLANQSNEINFDLEDASQFAKLAMSCIHREYPNKLGQVLGDSSYLKSPKELHPIFYGCFDWHSAVHGHWTMIKLLKQFPEIPEAEEIRNQLNKSFTEEAVAREIAYFDDEYNKNYERTYGWAWLLKLSEELYDFEDEDAQRWYRTIKPLTDLMVEKYLEFLPKLRYPIRVGEHPNTGFGLSFAYDYAIKSGHQELVDSISSRSRFFYMADTKCPIEWEPGGFDFLSPCLEEAELMSRVLPRKEFQTWFERFLPQLYSGALQLEPAQVIDRSDGKLVHLDGVNLSRAWSLYTIAENLEGAAHLKTLADEHLAFTLPNIMSGEYSGEHWLGSFTVYAMSKKMNW